MSIKSSLLAAATVGLSLASNVESAVAAPAANEEKCYGINSCKGTAKCGVSKSDVEATKAVFGDKFAKSATHDCAGHNACGASAGLLNWTTVPKGECVKKGGFLIVEKKGKKTVVSK